MYICIVYGSVTLPAISIFNFQISIFNFQISIFIFHFLLLYFCLYLVELNVKRIEDGKNEK